MSLRPEPWVGSAGNHSAVLSMMLYDSRITNGSEMCYIWILFYLLKIKLLSELEAKAETCPFEQARLPRKNKLQRKALCSWTLIIILCRRTKDKKLPKESTWCSGGRHILSVWGVATNPQTAGPQESVLRRRKSPTGVSSNTIPATPS